MRTVVSVVLIALVLWFVFMFVKKIREGGFDAAKGWAAGLFASITGVVADWWEQLRGVFQ